MTNPPIQTFQRTELCKLYEKAAKIDDAGLFRCARGVANLLKKAGLPYTSGDGYQWKDSLPKNGWVRLEGVTPENAPPGAVVAYDRDPEKRRKHNGAGSQFGHVEIAAIGADGKRKYISDDVRDRAGGTVPHNFAGVFWHPKMGPPPTVDTFMTAQLQQGAKGKDKKPGTYDYLKSNSSLTLDIGIPSVTIAASEGNIGIFNNSASNKNPLVILMGLLALAMVGGAVTGNSGPKALETAKPFS